MTSTLFVVIDNVSFAVVQTADSKLAVSQIQNAIVFGVNTYYITENLTPAAGALYVAKMNVDKSQVVLAAKSVALTPLLTFFGWAIPT
jgi:hypothetical protein